MCKCKNRQLKILRSGGYTRKHIYQGYMNYGAWFVILSGEDGCFRQGAKICRGEMDVLEGETDNIRRCSIGECTSTGLELSFDGELEIKDSDVERLLAMLECVVCLSNEGMDMGYIDGIGGSGRTPQPLVKGAELGKMIPGWTGHVEGVDAPDGDAFMIPAHPATHESKRESISKPQGQVGISMAEFLNESRQHLEAERVIREIVT
ncbi:hypothetical protein CPB84DRAFT_1743207 [Gymnopilus junonius]|uniref:Uncharacterized protein n=1 Tax=Gymnopilus junonius TaxID=109634 RepID=A0A9P5TTN2_GYMJU|nr:hypothetical protein CPB84DRAFT_1743207 [Gymnopilus junonius]